MDKEDFNKRFREMLSTLKITQQQVADRTGIAKSIISRYVNNKMNPRIINLQLIAKTFGVNPVWLMGYDVDMFDKDSTVSEFYYRTKLNSFVAGLNEKECEIAYNVLNAMFEK